MIRVNFFNNFLLKIKKSKRNTLVLNIIFESVIILLFATN